MAPIEPHMAHRLDNSSNLRDSLRKSMMYFLGRRAAVSSQEDPQPQQSKKRCTCEDVRGKGYSVVRRCCKCNMPLCTKHLLKQCLSFNVM